MGASLARTGSGGGGILEVVQGRLLQALVERRHEALQGRHVEAENRVYFGVREAEPVVRQAEQYRGGPPLELPPQRLVRHELADHDLEIPMGHRLSTSHRLCSTDRARLEVTAQAIHSTAF